MEIFNKALDRINNLTENFSARFINYDLVIDNEKLTLECDIRFMVGADNDSISANKKLMDLALRDIKKLKTEYKVNNFKFVVRKGQLKFIQGIFKIDI